MAVGPLLVLAAVPAFAEEPKAPGLPSEATAGQELSPLERLKSRSPVARWKTLSEHWTRNREAARTKADPSPTPAVSKKLSPQSAKPLGPATRPERIPLLTAAKQEVTSAAESYPEPVRDPSKLKKVTSILPYFDYAPDVKGDPCSNLCPRPKGDPCKPHQPGARVPECPEEVTLGHGVYEGRAMDGVIFQWKASNLYHNPLYFEDPALERYGHTHHELLQPFMSAGKFSLQLVGLPYQMTIDPICKKMYTLGWYRPGDCAPYLHHQIPWNTEAAVRQAGVVTGLIYAIP